LALSLPTIVRDQAVQQCLDFLARRFPIQKADMGKESVGSDELGKEAVEAGHLAKATKELFPQLATPGSHKEAFGSVTVKWAGGSNFIEKVIVVEHGLGAVPAAVALTITGTNIGAWLPPSVYLSADPTATKLEIQATANGAPTAGKTATVYWRAIT